MKLHQNRSPFEAKQGLTIDLFIRNLSPRSVVVKCLHFCEVHSRSKLSLPNPPNTNWIYICDSLSIYCYHGVRLFARWTFTTPKIRTFTTPKFGHFPPPKTKHLPGGQLPPPIFSSFFWRTFLGFFDLQLMEDIKDGKEEVLDEVVMEHIK